MEHLPALLLFTVIALMGHSVVWALAIPRQHLRQEAPYFAATVFGVFVFEALVIVAPLMMSQSNQDPLEGAHIGYMAYISVALPFVVLLIMGGKRSIKKAKDSGGEAAVFGGVFAGILAVFCGVALMVQLLAHVF
ncbi:hypothetical protein CO690_00040 (plasmid) [Rothia mucilaginosa]|uniref:Uncharacterized protein n=1 Tax=Rothia mucilaginosa TaxID=43675 RepID=A0A291DCM8_9MICC|nr:hypothetical protein [Rothia mucilaginosa]ATF62140.1 hypothetical protein CO690_00040 [Rothia mucilaginosa]